MKDVFKSVWIVYSTAAAAALLLTLVMPDEYLLNKTPLCESISKHGTECAACGMTRGFIHIAKFEFNEAMNSNKGSVYVFLGFFLNSLIFLKYLFRSAGSVKKLLVRRKQKWVKAV